MTASQAEDLLRISREQTVTGGLKNASTLTRAAVGNFGQSANARSSFTLRVASLLKKGFYLLVEVQIYMKNLFKEYSLKRLY